MPYKYGTYGEIVESAAHFGVEALTIPVYIGTAPINLVKGWKDKGLVNHPFRVKSLTDAQNNVGYCQDWKNYTLCEAIAAHFDSGEGIGPIYFINVLDPDVHKSEMPQSETISFVNGRAFLPGNETIVDSVKLERPMPADLAELPVQSITFRDKGVSKGDKNFDYAKAYGEAGIKLEGNTLTYEPTGKIDEHLLHDGYLVVGLKFTKPEKATRVTVKMNGQVVDEDLDLSKEGDFVCNGELIEYVAVADAAGNPIADKHLAFECEWTGSDSPKTALMVATGDGAYYTEGVDYELAYNTLRGGTVIQDLTGEMPKGVTVTYDVVDPSRVTTADIIGSEGADGKLTGISSLKMLFMETGLIANLLAAPGWSQDFEVCKALGRACRKMNGHWDAMYVADMPLKDNGKKIDTIQQALSWKATKSTGQSDQPFNDERAKVCWPQAVDTQGRIFHISTLTVAAMLSIDEENDGYPFETPGNKKVSIIKQYFGADSTNSGFDQQEAEDLCAKGITTVIPWATDWVIWGDHTSAFDYDNEVELDPRCVFDVSIRMLMHITNTFQREWAPRIDEPMTRALKDTIVNREQEKLDQLVSIGALIGHPTVSFTQEDNSTDELMNGQFTWSIAVTPTPPLKSATVKVYYTDDGFDAYWGEE